MDEIKLKEENDRCNVVVTARPNAHLYMYKYGQLCDVWRAACRRWPCTRPTHAPHWRLLDANEQHVQK